MFGERYFATRKKLAGVVNGVRSLAEATKVDLNGFGDESELLQGLKNPFLFVVCGEVNAGKSTLINGLFGEELCEVNILPQTDRVLWYRYGEVSRDAEITDVLEERYRPIDFLSDFNIVDTPGTNSVIRGHQVITERFLPVADLVLFVFPVSNPWGAATWDFIARFPEELSGKVAFILQQKDLREERELEIIMEHMRDLAARKLPETPEVFPVSGKLAMEAKGREPFQEKLWRQSGYPQLETFISKIVTNSPGRRQVLRDIRDATSGVLRRIEDKIEENSGDVDRQGGLLRDLETEVDHQRENYGAEFEEKIEALGEVFADEGDRALGLLRSRVAVWPSLQSLFRRDNSPREIEKDLSQAVEQAIGDLAEIEGEELSTLCRQHWEDVTPRIKEGLGVDPPRVEDGDVDREGAKKQFVRRMGRSARQTVVRLKLRGLLEMQLDARRNVLQRFVAAALVLLSIGGGLGAAGISPYSWFSILGALLVSAVGYWQARRSGEELVRWFGDRLTRSRENFTEMLSKEYRDGVREFFGEYTKLFEVVRRHIVDSKSGLKPRQKQWNDLFLELKAIEQEL